MITRRRWLTSMSILAGGSAMASVAGKHVAWFMPEEAEPHVRSWMAFCADEAVWGDHLVDEVHRNLALIANTIVKYEPVTMLVNKDDHAIARTLVNSRVELVVYPLDERSGWRGGSNRHGSGQVPVHSDGPGSGRRRH